MSKNISKQMMAILMRSGIEIWIDKEKAIALQSILKNLSTNIFIDFEGRSFNTADITGVFTPQDMEDLKRRKNGQYKCRFGVWHDRGEYCDCKSDKERMDDIKKTKKFIDDSKCII